MPQLRHVSEDDLRVDGELSSTVERAHFCSRCRPNPREAGRASSVTRCASEREGGSAAARDVLGEAWLLDA